jgi:hypothetical protein
MFGRKKMKRSCFCGSRAAWSSPKHAQTIISLARREGEAKPQRIQTDLFTGWIGSYWAGPIIGLGTSFDRAQVVWTADVDCVSRLTCRMRARLRLFPRAKASYTCKSAALSINISRTLSFSKLQHCACLAHTCISPLVN